ncbi:hypothetical protein PR202_ga07392 [Eleusine coracana subsp. coracana]|uniref:Peptidyl-prolyl cis-trans isomerase n=1 Tax=Eleusine coracana subsp. coracana TaxID=191504 RepID=A0AAV5BYL4_ELECO|nr:hypothetical protein QOZ80_2AG0111610 [Eleusine coracana subsp. coracana]GJM91057.1 hypothetical protein PR202_ga07392 [Eleusine coracana subsp. coracana]
MKYYNGCLFHNVQKGFIAQTGDPTGTGNGGDSVYRFLYGDQARFFDDEIRPGLRHSKTGTIAMAGAGKNRNASQFYITLRDDVEYLDDQHTVFGVVAEGFDTLTKISEAYVDNDGRPFQDIRIKHTYVLDDRFDDPPQLAELIPENSPIGKPRAEEVADERLGDSYVALDETVGPAQLEEMIRAREARTNAVALKALEDLPYADIKPPENVLFVCELNPVTQDEDLYTIFSSCGTVTSAETIRDYKTGDSLCYAFIEFETKEACDRAFGKMNGCLIDDRRIKVDFSQSASKEWAQFRQSKRNAKRDGCFKCGAPDHLARGCNKDRDQKNIGPKYILKNENTQHGVSHRRSYDLVFDKDGSDHPDKREHKTGHRNKIQRVHYKRSEGKGNRNSCERTFDSTDYTKNHNWSRNAENDEDYRLRDKSDGKRRHSDDAYGKSERRPESRHRREDGGYRDRNKYSDDRSHKERRHKHGRWICTRLL